MFGFDIVVTETTTVELEVDQEIANTYFSDSENEYDANTTRTFHESKDESKGSYVLPIDEFELERLDHQHEMMKFMMDDKMYLAPIQPDEIKNVLDVGTGHGKWAVAFASEFPNTQVIGTDLSPPDRKDAPENCKFVAADAEEPWDFPHKFDFIHLRDLMMCFNDQKEVFRAAFDALEPGGYCQASDGKLPLDAIDNSIEGTAVAKWIKGCVEAGEASGKPWTNLTKYMEWMEDIGFECVTETVFHNPINDWPVGAKEKKVGVMMQKDVRLFLNSTKQLLVEGLKWDVEETNQLLVEAKKNANDRNVHAYVPL
ncbi:hypothetical protein NHQ30_008555 [Ciborinia camelliae]|nr:hypothetical protein NHQ30_008555 [Ciborinia camelliae]